MSKRLINGVEYDVKINTMYNQPYIVINDRTTDVGMWSHLNDVDYKKEVEILLLRASKCYEYNKLNNTLKDNRYIIHKSDPTPEPKKKTRIDLLKDWLWN
jgi:hypothetical protein